MNPNFSQFKLLEGQVIDGKYRLIKLLGAGGFGAVFQADEVVRDRILRQVAVKLIPPAETAAAQAKQLNELYAAVNLDHPHIIRCFAAGEFVANSNNPQKNFWNKLQELFSSIPDSNQVGNGSFLYLVMELADYSLDSHLQDDLLSGQRLYQMIAQVASALNYLHANRLVHQDLKPGNVLWVRNVWKVSDFGTVRNLDTRSYVQTVHIAGTPLYMSPEALQGLVAPAWDMWSLGVMSVVAATGDVPEALSENSLPLELKLLVQGCLLQDWRKRWTAKQALDAMVTLKHSASPVPQVQPQPQASVQRIPPTAPNTAPTVPVNLRPSPAPQSKAPKPPIVTPPSPAPAPHQNYQELLPRKVPLEMIAIPAGSFLMGSLDGEGGDRAGLGRLGVEGGEANKVS
uniref:serine/threonine-protein kinase n=1 Tax=Trichocoleus desertorum TaxID=1481672 RepID=UPI0025B37A18|nr:serine/threonine protein kinase [Trichocoleus desertorum]